MIFNTSNPFNKTVFSNSKSVYLHTVYASLCMVKIMYPDDNSEVAFFCCVSDKVAGQSVFAALLIIFPKSKAPISFFLTEVFVKKTTVCLIKFKKELKAHLLDFSRSFNHISLSLSADRVYLVVRQPLFDSLDLN